MDGDVIDCAGEFGMVDPHVPWLGGRNRHVQSAPGDVDEANELRDREVAAQHRLVADQHAIDVAADMRNLDQPVHFPPVAREIVVQPGAECHAQRQRMGQAGDIGEHALHRVGPHLVRHVGGVGEVGLDLRLGRPRLGFRALSPMEGRKGQAAYAAHEVGNLDRPLGHGPGSQRQTCGKHDRGNRRRMPERAPETLARHRVAGGALVHHRHPDRARGRNGRLQHSINTPLGQAPGHGMAEMRRAITKRSRNVVRYYTGDSLDSDARSRKCRYDVGLAGTDR